MKKSFLIIVAAVVSVSCSKNGGNSITKKSTTCTCTYVDRPGHDTTVKFSMNAGGSTSVDSQCRYKEQTLLSYSGKGGASCDLY